MRKSSTNIRDPVKYDDLLHDNSNKGIVSGKPDILHNFIFIAVKPKVSFISNALGYRQQSQGQV